MRISGLIKPEELTCNQDVKHDINQFYKSIYKEGNFSKCNIIDYKLLIEDYIKNWELNSYFFNYDGNYIKSFGDKAKEYIHKFNKEEQVLINIPKTNLGTLKKISNDFNFIIVPLSFVNIEQMFELEHKYGKLTKSNLDNKLANFKKQSEKLFRKGNELFIICPIEYYDFWLNVCSEVACEPFFPESIRDDLLSLRMMLPAQKIFKYQIDKNSKEIETTKSDVLEMNSKLFKLDSIIKSVEEKIKHIEKRVLNNEKSIKELDKKISNVSSDIYQEIRYDRMKGVTAILQKRRYNLTKKNAREVLYTRGELEHTNPDMGFQITSDKHMSNNKKINNLLDKWKDDIDDNISKIYNKYKRECPYADPMIFSCETFEHMDIYGDNSNNILCALGFEWGDELNDDFVIEKGYAENKILSEYFKIEGGK